MGRKRIVRKNRAGREVHVIVRASAEKPWRCPWCWTVADPSRRARWRVVECCGCGLMFTRYPLLARVLPKAGVVCPQHKERESK